MTDLLYYRKEQDEFKQYYDMKLPSPRWNSVQIVVKKLYKHYGLNPSFIDWTTGRNHSKWSLNRILINLSHASFGLIAHEVAHGLAYKKYGCNVGHTKKHKIQMKRILAYLKKKKFFVDELTRRLAPRPEKPQPTKDEVRDQKIEKAKEKILRYKKKISFYTRKLGRAKRSLTMLQKNKAKLILEH